jgi:mono/diheme cytochrome c family protein
VRTVSILFAAVLALGLAGCSREVAGGKADGAAVYMEACARCHGRAGVPPADMVSQLRVPDLTSGEFHARMSDADIRVQIERGAPHKGMPGFAGALTGAQLDALVGHIRTFRN